MYVVTDGDSNDTIIGRRGSTEPEKVLENDPCQNIAPAPRLVALMRLPLSELLAPRQNTSEGRSSARVLTSAESIALPEEKDHKKGGARRER